MTKSFQSTVHRLQFTVSCAAAMAQCKLINDKLLKTENAWKIVTGQNRER